MLRISQLIPGIALAAALLPAVRHASAQVDYHYEVGYATYLGGSQWDQAREVIVLPGGGILIGAQTSSSNMPTTAGVVQPQYAGDDPNLGHGGVYGGDCYLAQLSADGSRVVAATYLGGSRQERNVYGMELDRGGNVVITSMTRSPDIPITPGCFQPRHGGGPGSCFVAKLTADLKQLVWCTYLGGSADESPRGGLALDEEDDVCVFGTTSSEDFPTTTGAHRTRRNGPRDAFVTKLRSDGSGLVWSTLFGGSGEDYMLGGRVDEAGDICFAGHTTSSDLPATSGSVQPAKGGQHDAFVTRLSRDGSRLKYVTYVGGRGNEFPEHRPYILADGSVLLPGVTASSNFPVTQDGLQRDLRGDNDAFLCQIAPDGSRFVFSTLLGGSKTEFCLMPLTLSNGDIVVVGQTESSDLPVTAGALQTRFGGGSDGWLVILSADGSQLRYCTYVGGSGNDMVRSLRFGPDGSIYLVGNTSSTDFPVTPGTCQPEFGGGTGDAFVMKLVSR